MKLYFSAYGEGYPLIILHGLFGSSENWQTLSRRFAQCYRVYAIDQRNHGRSPHSPVMNYKVMAEDLHDLLHNQAISSAYVLGHSMGGKTNITTRVRSSRLLRTDYRPVGCIS